MGVQAAIDKLKRRYWQSRYNGTVRAVLDTAPISPGANNYTALSMVHHRDVMSYLVAIKSFAAHASPARVTVVCDPSITDEDRRIFSTHIPHIEMLRAEDFRHPDLPTGGTWERLQAIAAKARTSYTVQVDADTVSMGALTEVVDAAKANAGFVIGEHKNQRILSLEQASENARTWSNQHIQAQVEKLLGSSGLRLRRYVRGCSGFTGFPVDEQMMSKLQEFSACLTELVGERWCEWGTEQVSSNFLVANSNDAGLLPFPDYRTPQNDLTQVRFGHFIGYMRFSNGLYLEATKAALRQFN